MPTQGEDTADNPGVSGTVSNPGVQGLGPPQGGAPPRFPPNSGRGRGPQNTGNARGRGGGPGLQGVVRPPATGRRWWSFTTASGRRG